MGRLILAPLQLINSKYVRVPRDAFVRTFQALETAERAVDDAEAVLQKATNALALADATQDEAVNTLATHLAGDGFNRTNPFKEFGAPAPAKLVKQSVMTEAATLITLAPRVAAHPKASAASKRAAAKMHEAATAARAASNVQALAQQKRSGAIDARDSDLPKQFRVALTNLKAAVRYGDSIEQTTNYVAVFRGSSKPRGKSSVKPENEPVQG